MSGRYELLVADPAFGSTIAMLACPGPAPRTMLDVSRASRVVADWLLTELNALLDRAEKAEARVAELEREVAITARCPHCGTLNEAPTAEWGRGFVCGCGRRIVKPAPKTPVPAPEGTETAQNQAQTAGTGPSCHDQASRGVAAGAEPAPVLGDLRGYTLLSPFDLFALGTADERCGLCWKVGSDRLNIACRACAAAIWHNSKPRDGKCHPARNCPICTGRIPDPSAYPTATTRVEASPAAAAEVEARTGAYVMQSGGVVTISAIDGVVVEVRHPLAGLPSRDEVAAFLEARWPTDPRKPCVDPDCLVCRMGL